MKKYLLTSIIVLTGLTGFSQFNKGNILVGGSTNAGFGFTTNKIKANGNTTTDSKTTSFNLNPKAAFFVADNIAVGAGINFGTGTTKDDGSSQKSSSTYVTLAPLARYYFSKLYAQVEFEVGSEKSKFTPATGTSSENTDNITGWSLGIGYPILLNESVTIEPLLGYGSITRKDENDAKYIQGGLFFSIGVYGYLSNLGKK